MTLQTSRNTNKQDINTNFGNPHLTLKEGPKVKSDHTKRFPAHDFLDFGLPSKALGPTRGSLAKKKIMFMHRKNKASRKGYKGEC